MDDSNIVSVQVKLREFRYRQELLSHPFFKKMNYWTDFQIQHLKIENTLKKNMVSLFFKISIKEFYDTLQEFLKQGSHVKVEEFPELFSTILDTIESKCIREGIPSMFITKFEETQRSHLQSIEDSIRYIVNSKIYFQDIDKINAILDVLLYYFIFVALITETIINEMNGSLEKLLKGSKFNI